MKLVALAPFKVRIQWAPKNLWEQACLRMRQCGLPARSCRLHREQARSHSNPTYQFRLNQPVTRAPEQ